MVVEIVQFEHGLVRWDFYYNFNTPSIWEVELNSNCKTSKSVAEEELRYVKTFLNSRI